MVNRSKSSSITKSIITIFKASTKYILCLSVALSLCVKKDLNAQEPKKRKTVGLVLSGGGARGLAHIGVLKWLEDHRIPVDYVAGTSMGGLVAGLYAMGYSSEEMRRLVLSINWNEMITAGPSYNELSFRRKEDHRAYQVGIELGLKHGPRLPLGISTDHYIGMFFDRLTLPYYDLKSFDDLPIPYRAVATDFIRAKSVVMKDGTLASAMRATMSIPGVFPPVKRDGMVLVDGGLLNNIPTNVVKEFNPDVIIAVNVGTPLGGKNEVASLPGIFSQTVNVMTIENDRRNLQLADIVVAPDLQGYTSLGYSEAPNIIDAGYKSTQLENTNLEKLSLDETQWKEYLDSKNARKKTNIPASDGLEITGISINSQRDLAKRLRQYAFGTVNTTKLEPSLTRIVGQGKYRSIQYRVEKNASEDNANLLIIDVTPKTYAPPTMNFSVEMDASDVSEVNFTVGTRLTFYDLLKHGSELRNDAKIGYGNIFSTEYFIPFGLKGFFVAPNAGYRLERRDFFVGDVRDSEMELEKMGGGVSFGYVLRKSELRIGYEAGHITAKVRAGTLANQQFTNESGAALPNRQFADGTASSAFFRWTFDGQNSNTIPTAGSRFTTEGRWFFKNPSILNSPKPPENFAQAQVKISNFIPVGNKGSFMISANGGTSFGQDNVGVQQFYLGGPFKLGAYNRDELRGNRYLLATAGYLKKIGELPQFVGGKAYAAAWYDLGGAYGGVYQNVFDNKNLHSTASLGFIVDTIMGPFSFVGSYGQGGRGKIYFALGKFF